MTLLIFDYRYRRVLWDDKVCLEDSKHIVGSFYGIQEFHFIE